MSLPPRRLRLRRRTRSRRLRPRRLARRGSPRRARGATCPRPRRRPTAGPRRWPAALGVIAVGLLVIGAVAVVTDQFTDDGPGHPDEWDPRVADLAAFVEDERGLDFDHPVYVDFLTAGRVHGADHR